MASNVAMIGNIPKAYDINDVLSFMYCVFMYLGHVLNNECLQGYMRQEFDFVEVNCNNCLCFYRCEDFQFIVDLLYQLVLSN
jgi:hypothetical protein